MLFKTFDKCSYIEICVQRKNPLFSKTIWWRISWRKFSVEFVLWRNHDTWYDIPACSSLVYPRFFSTQAKSIWVGKSELPNDTHFIIKNQICKSKMRKRRFLPGICSLVYGRETSWSLNNFQILEGISGNCWHHA